MKRTQEVPQSPRFAVQRLTDGGEWETLTHADNGPDDPYYRTPVVYYSRYVAECIAKSYRDETVRVREIVASYWAKPIPARQFDWQAHYDGDEPNDHGQMKCGHGRTKQEAINDLLEIGGAA